MTDREQLLSKVADILESPSIPRAEAQEMAHVVVDWGRAHDHELDARQLFAEFMAEFSRRILEEEAKIKRAKRGGS